MRRRLIGLAFGLGLFGCLVAMSSLAPVAAEEPVVLGADPSVPPTKKKRLLAWLADGTYRDLYVAEPEVHASAGPHGGNVRTYFNSILVEDLRAGATTFRKGAAMVKELYFGGTDAPVGYAVMVKVKKNAGDRGQGWLFLETFDGTGNGAFYGRGIGVCANCHGAGTDYLLSPFRP